eukprot:5497505-Prymnesium_polylepis.1
MHRPEWQLFDVAADPLGLHNLAAKSGSPHGPTLRRMQQQLRAWQVATHDPWTECRRTSPGGAGGGAWAETHSA